ERSRVSSHPSGYKDDRSRSVKFFIPARNNVVPDSFDGAKGDHQKATIDPEKVTDGSRGGESDTNGSCDGLDLHPQGMPECIPQETPALQTWHPRSSGLSYPTRAIASELADFSAASWKDSTAQ
ncbi:MAG: hypothetical protein ACI814_004818, partial [Mariniblastus sp.]